MNKRRFKMKIMNSVNVPHLNHLFTEITKYEIEGR